MKWCANQLKREDGMKLIAPLIDMAYQYKATPEGTSNFHRHMAQARIRDAYEWQKNTVFKQRRLLIAAPMRRRVLPEGLPPPNLAGIVIPQSIWHTALPVYGLGHAESRNYDVDFALKDGSFTHILFVDEDQLVPIHIVKTLMAYNLP